MLFNYVARDLQSTTAKNIKLVKETSGPDPWIAGARELKNAIQDNLPEDIPPLESWKVRYLMSLLRQLQEAKHCVQDDRMKYLQDLIDSQLL